MYLKLQNHKRNQIWICITLSQNILKTIYVLTITKYNIAYALSVPHDYIALTMYNIVYTCVYIQRDRVIKGFVWWLQEDFIYGEYDGHHTYHEGHEKKGIYISFQYSLFACGFHTIFHFIISCVELATGKRVWIGGKELGGYSWVWLSEQQVLRKS